MSDTKTKNYLLIGALALAVIFFAMWYFKPGDNIRNNRELEQEITRIQSMRDSIQKAIVVLQNEQKVIEDSLLQQRTRLSQIDNDLLKTEKDLQNARARKNRALDEYDKLVADINKLKVDIKPKTGDDLLNSLREKTQ